MMEKVKTVKRLVIAGAIGCMALSACTREVSQEPVTPGGEMVITANLSDEAGTKTTVQNDGITVYWTTDEDIKVFFGDSMSGQFHSTNTAASATATFRGSLNGTYGSGTDFWGLYPYDADAVCDGSSVTMTVPATQQGIAGTFADKLFPLLAKSSDRNFTFYNVCGGARFSVTQAGITSVVLRAVGGETLAGKVKVGFGSDGKPVVQEVLEGVSEVMVTAPEGGFVPGEDYFAALLPGTLAEGLSLTICALSDNVVQTISHAITINRSRFGKLDAIDEDIWDEAHKFLTITSLADENLITFTKLNNSAIPVISGNFWYSLDQGGSWTSIGSWEDLTSFSQTLNNGETLLLKGELDKACFGYKIGLSLAATVSGNIMSLVGGNDFAEAAELEAYAFSHLFEGSPITDASQLVLPAMTLKNNCYDSMFAYCMSLTAAPSLPATTLAERCYADMFNNCFLMLIPPSLPAKTMAASCYESMFEFCNGLTSAPALPATTLAERCYADMFSGCIALTGVPALPARTLKKECYSGMFANCTALNAAPELPASSLAEGCYESMFAYCSSLAQAPSLPATGLAPKCYWYMFRGCEGLTQAPSLPATTLAYGCYGYMFEGCIALTTAPVLPATTLVNECYRGMFYRCTNLSYVKALFMTIPTGATYSTSYWLYGVASQGTFVKPADATWNVTGTDGVPEGWSIKVE